MLREVLRELASTFVSICEINTWLEDTLLAHLVASTSDFIQNLSYPASIVFWGAKNNMAFFFKLATTLACHIA